MSKAASDGVESTGPGTVSLATGRRAALHDEAVRRLRNMILNGELAPGSRVPERELCEKLVISRTPLREALKILASEGLIQLMPHRGATVTRMSQQDLDHAFRVIETLEALAGELACERISDAEVAMIAACHAQMLRHYERGERPQYFRLNQEIHGRIVSAAANPPLSEIHQKLSRRIQQARYMPNYSAARWQRAAGDHEDMLKALQARDGERMASILRRHLWHKRKSSLRAAGEGD